MRPVRIERGRDALIDLSHRMKARNGVHCLLSLNSLSSRETGRAAGEAVEGEKAMNAVTCLHPMGQIDQCISTAFNPNGTHRVLQVCTDCGARRWLLGRGDEQWISPSQPRLRLVVDR